MKKQVLKIVKGINIPIEAVTQKFAVMGISGSGKSYTSSKLAEEMLGVGAQIVVLDPVGIWRGLQLDASGTKSSGFYIPVFGGLHGDLPLDHKSGKLIAKTLVDTGVSAILDVSLFRKNQQKQFVTEFSEDLFHLRAQRPAAMHVFLEEAHKFAPQMAQGQEQMLGAIEDLVRLGRNHGIGVTIIDQRPQSVNKNILNQAECLFVHRLVAAHERKAVMDWVREAGVDLQGMADELPTLKTGEAMLWSPSWLKVFERVHILPKVTFDTSATPKVGQKALKSAKIAKLDVAQLREAMAEFVQNAEANDPKALKEKVVQLERQLANVKYTPTEKDQAIVDGLRTIIEASEDKVKLLNNQNKELRGAIVQHLVKVNDIRFGISNLASTFNDSIKSLEDFHNAVHSIDVSSQTTVAKMRLTSQHVATGLETMRRKAIGKNGSAAEDSSLPEAQRKILEAVGWWTALGFAQPTKVQVGMIAGYSQSGHFNNMVGSLRSKGLVDYAGRGCLELCDTGKALVSHILSNTPRNDNELHSAIRERLPSPQKTMFDHLLQVYPKSLTKTELASLSGYSMSGHFNNMVGGLRSKGLIRYPARGEVALTSNCFC